MIRAKTHTLSSQVIDAGKDTGDEELAEEFATFFMNKIKKIRDALDTHPKFKPS